MPNNKKPDILSLLSKNGLTTLKKKLNKKNDECPISTLNQLMQPNQTKINSSLRSLRTKSRLPESNENASDINIQMEHVLSISSNRVNSTSDRGPGNSLQDVTNQINLNPTKDPVFAVPTMRAPRIVRKEREELVDEFERSSALAWCTLDKMFAHQLFYILQVYIMAVIEENLSGTSNMVIGGENNILSVIKDWIQKMVSGYEDSLISLRQNDFEDHEDNMSLISGCPTYRGGFGNQYLQPQGRGLLPGFMNFSSADSVVGSMFQPRNDLVYQSMMRHNMDMQGSNYMMPGRGNFNTTGSVAGSVFQRREDPYNNQSYMYNYPRMNGYAPSWPSSVRSEASFARPRNNFSAMMNPGNNHQRSQHGLFRMEPSMNGNIGNINSGPKVMMSRLNRFGDNNQSRFQQGAQNNEEPSRRNPLSPLEPFVSLERIKMSDGTRVQVLKKGEKAQDEVSPNTYNLRRLNDSRQIPKTKRAENINLFKAPPKRIQQVERIVTTPVTEVSRSQNTVIKVTRSGRAVRAPQTFWASEVSCVGTNDSIYQARGIKRKRMGL